MWSLDRASTDMGPLGLARLRAFTQPLGSSQGGRLGSTWRDIVKDPDHSVTGAWEISSELAKCTFKSSQSPTSPQLSRESPV